MATTSTTLSTYRLKDVENHKGRESCWIVIDGKVYDVTKYLDQHPGGDQEILNEGGTEATKAFVEVGHSSDAREILAPLIIGVLHPDDVEELARKNSPIPWTKITAFAFVPMAIALVIGFVLVSRKR